MITFNSTKAIAIGEAMIEMAPVQDGLYRRGFAGDTFNTAWHLAQALGSRGRVGFATRVGTDRLSDAFVAELNSDGLDTSSIGRDAERTMGLYLIELDGVERSFHYWRKDSAARLIADDREWLEQAFVGQGLIHLSGITVAILPDSARTHLIDALSSARARGTRVSFDPNIRPQLWSSNEEIRSTIPRFLEVADIALPSFDDEQTIWGDATPRDTLARFSASGVTEIIVKNGAGQLAMLVDGHKAQIDTPAVWEICDTTGAGDAFNAGYLAARLIGKQPRAAVAFGQQMSAEVIRHFGARIPKASVPPIARGLILSCPH
ncbi:sugar kinase [Sedimentimonas flavescens]|uniref:Sugar kinase n=1 Tax=Sedimentimonas flavescens TaxID=2851012 RepID=A0ABT3A2Q8_9RHOB|nr:sugar kinase [Sedimentimonas flavescens]MCV2880228.1 sugar kinase [Sedimentimonas flavescens]